jgi:hypothetical protein
MNYYFDLPNELILHIQFFVKTSYVITIIKSFKKYFYYKKFIIKQINILPVHHSFFTNTNNVMLYNIVNKKTLFYFYNLSKLINGRESYIDSIWFLFWKFADSISDFEWVTGNLKNNYYIKNRLICYNTSYKFNWFNILEILET